MLAGLAPAMRKELKAALESLNSEWIEAVIGRISEGDGELSARLNMLAENFDYPAILKALEGMSERAEPVLEPAE